MSNPEEDARTLGSFVPAEKMMALLEKYAELSNLAIQVLLHRHESSEGERDSTDDPGDG